MCPTYGHIYTILYLYLHPLKQPHPGVRRLPPRGVKNIAARQSRRSRFRWPPGPENESLRLGE